MMMLMMMFTKKMYFKILRWAFFWSNKTNLARCHSWHYYIGITCSHTCINGLPGYHLLHHSAISRPLLSKLQNWSRTKRRQESKRLPGRKSSWWVCATSCTSSSVGESSRTSDTTVVLQSSSLYTGCRQSVICHSVQLLDQSFAETKDWDQTAQLWSQTGVEINQSPQLVIADISVVLCLFLGYNILRHNLKIIPKLVATFRSPTVIFIRLVVTWCWATNLGIIFRLCRRILF